MTAICLICTLVSLVCLVFNAIIVKKFGRFITEFIKMQDSIKNLSSISSLSSLSEMGNIK